MQNYDASLVHKNFKNRWEQSQAELAAIQFVGKSAQDLVQATLTGDKKLFGIGLQPAVVGPEDLETFSFRYDCSSYQLCS